MKKSLLFIFAGALIAFLLLCFFYKKKIVHSVGNIITNKKAVNFIAIGDWGRKGKYDQADVAQQMAVTADTLQADFFISTGDNFYPHGISTVNDPDWAMSFENIYDKKSLFKNWYAVLGNHDYDGNVQAEIDYTKISTRWKMPARYFSEKATLKDDTTKKILLVFIDTPPLVYDYNFSKQGADTINQYISQQIHWVDSVLADTSSAIKWRIVCGHHPLYTEGGRVNSVHTKKIHDMLRPLFEKYKVDAYVCGHEHSLQCIKPEGYTTYFISGAGSQTTPVKLHPDGGKFAASASGFITFTISSNTFLAQIINSTGQILFSEKINK